MGEALDRLSDCPGGRGRLAGAGDPLDLDLEHVAAGHRDREPGVVEDVLVAERPSHLDVVDDGRDERRELQRLEVVGELLLQRADELLLARHPVVVVVGVAEADELERSLAVEQLVARLQVDVGVVGRGAADIPVVVAPVDVEPDAAELVDDLLEAVEVHGHQVVDPEARRLLDGGERAGGLAVGVRCVDPVERLEQARPFPFLFGQ